MPVVRQKRPETPDIERDQDDEQTGLEQGQFWLNCSKA